MSVLSNNILCFCSNHGMVFSCVRVSIPRLFVPQFTFVDKVTISFLKKQENHSDFLITFVTFITFMTLVFSEFNHSICQYIL